MSGAIEDALAVLADAIADKVVERLRAGQSTGMRSQRQSPLGPRRHAAAVRRRVGAGEAGAAIVGRDFLLTDAAIAEELKRPARARKQAAADGSDLAAELGLKLVAGGKRAR